MRQQEESEITVFQELLKDKDTGELISKREVVKKKYKRKHYVRLFAIDIALLAGLRANTGNVLWAILQYTDFNNELIITAGRKKILAKSLGVTAQAVHKSLNALVGAGLIKRDENDVSLYSLNSKYFYKGKWDDMDKAETSFNSIEVSITYDKNGRRIESKVK